MRSIVKEETVTLIVQINGRVRDRISVPAGTPDEELKNLALGSDKIKRQMENKEPRKIIVVKGKLVNIVV